MNCLGRRVVQRWNLFERRRVVVFDSVDSTNSVAAALADPADDGLVVIAGHQTAGRGRFGRVWQSRPGVSLLTSVVLFPPAELRRPAVLTAWAAVAVGEAVFALTGVQAKVKWPNDLLIRGKKVCGILIEQRAGRSGAPPATAVFRKSRRPRSCSAMLSSRSIRRCGA